MGAPCAAVPVPAGRPVPSGMMLMSQGAMSASLIGLPRPGPSAANALTANRAAVVAANANLRIDMAHLPLAVDRPTRDRIEMLAGESEHRGRHGRLSTDFHEIGARRLHRAALIP